MDFKVVMETRRSVRAFAKREIAGGVLAGILEAGRMAPSACNFQPWRFVVVTDAVTKGKLVGMCKGQGSVGEAAAVVVCCGKRYENPYNWVGENLYLMDVAIAIDHMALAARDAGVGSCWIGAFDHAPIKELIGVPKEYDVVMLLVLGYPAEAGAFHTTTERLGREQVVFGEKWAER